MIGAAVAENSTGIEKYLEVFNTLVDTLEHIWGIIGAVIAIVVIVWALFGIVGRSRRFSKRQVAAFKVNGKYIPGVFVELNNTKEYMRYFVYGKKWKKRLISQYNAIYDNFYGDILQEALPTDELKLKLLRTASLSDIEDAVVKADELHKRFAQRGVEFKPDYKESQYLFEIIHVTYEYALQGIINFVRAADSRHFILTGSAGNGKTNMLCSITELLVSLKQGVVLLYSRDLTGDIADYIFDELHLPGFWKNHKNSYFGSVNRLLHIKRKRLFIIIDAINENDKDGFGDRVREFLDFVSKYDSIKIIVSCRNEYYEERFKKYLTDGVTMKTFECDLKDEPYSTNAQTRIIEKYREYFKYTGNISRAVSDVLCKHLLLLRIFFEVYKNTDRDVEAVHKHEIFRGYIENLKDSGLPNIEKVIDVVVTGMLKTGEFDHVSKEEILTELRKVGVTDSEIEAVFDGNALVGRKLVYLKDTIGETTEEKVYFVFDELRDYCIAQKIVRNHTNNGIVDLDGILGELDAIKDKEVSCEEGLIHYLYVFFRTYDDIAETKRLAACKKILGYYQITDNEENGVYKYYGQRHREEFINLGLKIIFTTGLELCDFEYEYIRDCLKKNPHEDGGKIFDVLLEGTVSDAKLNLGTYLDILFGISDKDCFCEAFGTMSSRGMGHYCDYPEDLINWHRALVNEDGSKACMIQYVAEMFLICFRMHDERVQEDMELYFFELPDHETVKDRAMARLVNLFREE